MRGECGLGGVDFAADGAGGESAVEGAMVGERVDVVIDLAAVLAAQRGTDAGGRRRRHRRRRRRRRRTPTWRDRVVRQTAARPAGAPALYLTRSHRYRLTPAPALPPTPPLLQLPLPTPQTPAMTSRPHPTVPC